MKKFLSFAIVLLFLVSGPSWARKKSSDETDSGAKHHAHKKHGKGSKGKKDSVKVEGQIGAADVTFNFKDDSVKSGKSRKKKKDSSDESEGF